MNTTTRLQLTLLLVGMVGPASAQTPVALIPRVTEPTSALYDTGGRVGINAAPVTGVLDVLSGMYGDGSAILNLRVSDKSMAICGPHSTAVGPDPAWTFNSQQAMKLRVGNDDRKSIMLSAKGNVGIGTTAPADALTVRTTTSSYGFTQTDGNITVGSFVGGSSGGGWYGTKSLHSLSFFTNDSPAQMTLAVNGNVGIGTTQPRQRLDVSGNICYTGTSAACSDRRYKTDFTPLNGSLAKVSLLNGLYYQWRTEEFPDKRFPNERQVGFIAQDIEQHFPEVVVTDSEGYKSVDYGRLTPVLVEAIKELNAALQQQQATINELQASNAAKDETLKAILMQLQANTAAAR